MEVANLRRVGNRTLCALLCAALLVLPAAAAAQAPDPRGVDPNSVNPLLGTSWYVNKGLHPAWRQYRRYLRQGKRHRARLMWKIAREPKFHWFGRFSRMEWLRDHIAAAEREGTVPLLTVLRHQGRGCGRRYAGGGPAEDERTREWYRAFAATVGVHRVVIAFEPDSLGTIDCLGRRWRQARLDLLRYGVDVLSQLPNATIYLEAGASDWEPARRTAKQLRYIGIHKVRGFMLNVTHYDWTLANVRHGLDISARTGGKPFIVNTATNGRGPVHFRNSRRRVINVWCHPLMRGLGIPPTTATHHPKVDAYMWINRPGYSGGACNGGPLPVGSWWPERALMLAKYQTTWIRPAHGTRFGLFRRYSIREVAGDGYR
jgi:endoglucanase